MAKIPGATATAMLAGLALQLLSVHACSQSYPSNVSVLGLGGITHLGTELFKINLKLE